MFPVVRVHGSAYERGRQYGTAARRRIHRSIASYAMMYAHDAALDWQAACGLSRRFLPAIEDRFPAYLEELRGIADGAEVSLDDVVAVNARTEIMYSARMRTALALVGPMECTTFAAIDPAGRVIAGQNWDWMPFALDTVVVLEAEPDEGPAYVTVVEAGLLAKFGVNSARLAVMTNALACDEDLGEPGIPYHVLLRSLLDCGSADEGVRRAAATTRASSANYLLADATGRAVDVEARPGDAAKVHVLDPDSRGVVLHTNHFCSPAFDATDYATLVASTTDNRLERVTQLVGDADDPYDIGLFATTLADHVNAPASLCRHPDMTLPEPERSMTVASGIVDLTAGTMLVSEGPPCERGYEPVEIGWLFG